MKPTEQPLFDAFEKDPRATASFPQTVNRPKHTTLVAEIAPAPIETAIVPASESEPTLTPPNETFVFWPIDTPDCVE